MPRHGDKQTSWITVIGIVFAILIFASIAIPGCPPPRPSDRLVSRYELEVFSQATTAFLIRHGDLPPTGTVASVRKHLLTLNPHFDFSTVDVDAIAQLDDAERLVFWLGGGFPDCDFGFERERFYEFDMSRFVDRDEDGFPEHTSRFDGVFEYDANAERVSCDFSDDELTVTIDQTYGSHHTQK